MSLLDKIRPCFNFIDYYSDYSLKKSKRSKFFIIRVVGCFLEKLQLLLTFADARRINSCPHGSQ